MTDQATFRLKNLKLQRNNCITQLTTLRTLADNAGDNPALRNSFKVRAADLDIIKQLFLKHHDAICN